MLPQTATVELELGMLRQDLEKLHANLAAQHSQIEECQDEKVSMFLGARKVCVSGSPGYERSCISNIHNSQSCILSTDACW
jgi:hypothetical protein